MDLGMRPQRKYLICLQGLHLPNFLTFHTTVGLPGKIHRGGGHNTQLIQDLQELLSEALAGWNAFTVPTACKTLTSLNWLCLLKQAADCSNPELF